jgi:hypothetical protein
MTPAKTAQSSVSEIIDSDDDDDEFAAQWQTLKGLASILFSRQAL